jgi:hypothetical protein
MTDQMARDSASAEHPLPRGAVPCFYCFLGIPTESFVPWDAGSRLISASCRSCDRRITLTIDSLRELAVPQHPLAP